MKNEVQKTQREWCEREREKLKTRLELTTDPTLRAYYRNELSAMAQRILTLKS